MMEEESVNNDLLLDQFAIVAKPIKSFAMYRVDPPYKLITEASVGGGQVLAKHYGGEPPI